MSRRTEEPFAWMQRGHPLEPRIVEDILWRLRDHLERINAQDWGYFADLRYRQEAKLAVSDLWRLEGHIRALGRGAA